MSAGRVPAGRYPAGRAGGTTVPGGRVVPVVQALLLDPVARDFVMSEDGFYEGNHPVDARVTLQMTVVAASIGVTPGNGNEIATYQYNTPDITTRVRYEVRRALKAEIDAGNIEIQSITVQTTDSRLLVELRYINLRLPEQADRGRTVTVPLNGFNPNPVQ